MSSNKTSTTLQRKWIQCSHRWRKEMEELAHLEESEVMKVGGLTFVPDEKRFMIIQTEKTEVLLGLRDDGTEVAIKMMRKLGFKMVQQELEILLKHRFTSRHVVQYVDSAEDKYFGYIAMQLCECTLAEYISAAPLAERKSKAKEFLKGLKDLHEANVIHRDIKPHNVLIDKDGRVRLADFGLSRILDLDQTSKETGNAGTPCWVATEIIKNHLAGKTSRYKRSTDIQVAGMLVYYILSGGKHPFGDPVRCHGNICDGKYTLQDLNDEEVKDLVESMLNIIPKERPRITEVLKHPYFWEEDRKEMFLREVGNVGEVEKYGDFIDDESLVKGKTFSTWKTELNDVTDVDDMKSMKRKWLTLVEEHAGDDRRFPQTLLGLLRFIRNRLVDSKDEMKEINVMKLFPDLVVTAYKCAKERAWEVKGFLPLTSSEKRKADWPIPTQEAQEPGGQTQEMKTLSESSLMDVARPSPSGRTQEMKTLSESSLMDVDGPSPSGRTQEMKTWSESSLMDVARLSLTKAAEFVDRHRAELIGRVSNVMPIADALLSKGLHPEKYSEIKAAATSQAKMREIYECLRSAGAEGKAAFYGVLLQEEPHLLKDLSRSSSQTVAPSVSYNQVQRVIRHASAPSRHPSPGQDFFSNHKAALETRLPVLTTILILLQQRRVLSDLEREQVESKPTSTERNHVLLTMIQRKGATAQMEFYEVLKEQDPHLVQDLEGYCH
ncbi:uncharacterized protein LOC143122151 isoform X2 [Alosa pseudoharengus]|uniref:uncharacterized protein LOC143122151 isoform X2 n=1 Tax=Alosa pseudoharengus TaxID=34774 RepID=UPI003F8CB1BC